MPLVSALACVQCGARYPADHYARDCEACRRAGAPANLTVVYERPPGLGLDRAAIPRAPASQWRWEAFLPAAASEAVTLSEGNTPLLPVPALGLGDLWIKDETRNPTWSFKDRLASAAVTMAKRFGAKLIVSSSSGNAGASAAAYAAKAGLPCVVFVFRAAAAPMVTQLRAYGAMVIMVETSLERWPLQAAGVERFGWYPTSPFFAPVVGSNPYGVEGYKTIAFEIAEALDWLPPHWCVLPVTYGDALHGMWKGFEELKALGFIDRVPRFAAAETSGSLGAALASGDKLPPVRSRNAVSLATSIAGSQGTVQALDVLRRSDGAAVTVENEELTRWLVALASTEGIWAEPASVAPLAAIERLRQHGTIEPDARVVALVTASGLKDTAAIDVAVPAAPLVRGGIDDVLRALKDVYRFDHG
jgi:threonine synthase